MIGHPDPVRRLAAHFHRIDQINHFDPERRQAEDLDRCLVFRLETRLGGRGRHRRGLLGELLTRRCQLHRLRFLRLERAQAPDDGGAVGLAALVRRLEDQFRR